MKLFTHLAVACVLVLAFGCSQDGASTPTSPELNSELGALQNTTAAAKNAVLLCHFNDDFYTDPYNVDPLWHVISVAGNGNYYEAHVVAHGDFTTGTCGALSGLAVGDDCGICAAI